MDLGFFKPWAGQQSSRWDPVQCYPRDHVGIACVVPLFSAEIHARLKT